MATSSWVNQLRHFPLPGTATIFVLDRVTILGYQLPLDRPIEAGISLDVEKRKEPGSDYSSYVSHGIDTTPIRITLRLFKDISSGKNWFENYDAVKDRLISKFLSRRNAVPVYHPFLDEEGINSIVFTDRSIKQPGRGHFFIVSLTGYNPRTLRVGSGSGAGSAARVQQDTTLTSRASTVDANGKSKAVTSDKQNTAVPAARQAPGNVRTPAQNQAGQATRRTTPG